MSHTPQQIVDHAKNLVTSTFDAHSYVEDKEAEAFAEAALRTLENWRGGLHYDRVQFLSFLFQYHKEQGRQEAREA